MKQYTVKVLVRHWRPEAKRGFETRKLIAETGSDLDRLCKIAMKVLAEGITTTPGRTEDQSNIVKIFYPPDQILCVWVERVQPSQPFKESNEQR